MIKGLSFFSNGRPDLTLNFKFDLDPGLRCGKCCTHHNEHTEKIEMNTKFISQPLKVFACRVFCVFNVSKCSSGESHVFVWCWNF